MQEVFITGDNIISSLGFTAEENYYALKRGTIGIRGHNDDSLSPFRFPLSMVDQLKLDEAFAGMLCELGREVPSGSLTRLEKMLILSIHHATRNLQLDLKSSKLLFILSTTKGNIHLLEEKYCLLYDHKRLFLWDLAKVVRTFFGFSQTPVIVSNACISGVVAILMGTRYIRSGAFSHVVVAGGDILSEFVISGFHSFQSLSPEPCRPYDISRNGLSLGEGSGAMVLTGLHPETLPVVKVLEGSITNDANHISGPSRTGEELGIAMMTAMERSGLRPGDIDLISAHGTATPFNDEMESKAITYSRLNNVPVNSMKGYWGHTLGAAGVIESVASVRSLLDNTLIASAGFTTLGVPEPINVIGKTVTSTLHTCLKTASGFGGCNAAIVLQKE